MAFLELDHVSVVFPAVQGLLSARKSAPVVAVDGVSLSVEKGEILGLVGESGCGKSTLSRTVMLLQKPTEGRIFLEREELTALSASEVRKRRPDFQMVFQDPYASLNPRFTVYATLKEALQSRRKRTFAQTRDDVAELMEKVGLSPSLMRKYPHEFSGGQRQRVAMGRAIVREPSVFLFDEPLSNLDAKLRVQTRLQIQKLHRRLKTTSLYVTHDQVEAMTLAHRMIVMNAGRAEQVGTPQEVYDDPETMFVANFIGSPPMNLVHGRVSADGSHFEHDSGVLSLPEPCTALAGRAVVLGVRPEHVTLRPEGGLAAFEVETVEALGADHLIHGVLLGQNVVFRVDNHMYIPEVGIRAGLEFSAEHVYWFDPETTKRIRL